MKHTTIIETTARYFDRTVAELMSRDGHYPLTEHRQIAMFLCRELAGMSSPSVGLVFDRDHSTVLYAERKMRRARGRLRLDIDRLSVLLKTGVTA